MLKSRWKTIAAWLAVLIVLGVGGYFALKTLEGCQMSTDRPVYTKSLSGLRQWESLSPERRQILELHGKYASELFKHPFVHGVGARKNALSVFIDYNVSLEDRARIPSKLEGCDVEVIESDRDVPKSKPFNSKIRPLVGATQEGVVKKGTLFKAMLCAAAEGVIPGSVRRYVVEPLHVMALDVLHPRVGEKLYQPASPST